MPYYSAEKNIIDGNLYSAYYYFIKEKDLNAKYIYQINIPFIGSGNLSDTIVMFRSLNNPIETELSCLSSCMPELRIEFVKCLIECDKLNILRDKKTAPIVQRILKKTVLLNEAETMVQITKKEANKKLKSQFLKLQKEKDAKQ